MLSWVQVVSTPTADTPGACVLLHFDNRRYLFGHVAEGSQRHMTQRKIGLSKLDEMFISGPVTWATVGGLIGMVLTIADVVAAQNVPLEDGSKRKKKHNALGPSTIPSLKIYAAENINHMIATTRKFIFRKGLPLRVHEILHEPPPVGTQERKPDFEDANVKVWYLSLEPEEDKTPKGRKRSHDDMVAEDSPKDVEQQKADKDLVKSIVNNMFDSDWDLDALVQTTLHQVALPAAIFVKGKDGKIEKYDGPMPGGSTPAPDIPVLVRKPWPAAKVHALPRTSPSRHSLSYIVKAQPRRGKFNAEEAIRRGVQKWDFKLLTNGKTVKGKDGIDVTPEMCVGATIEGRGFAFIDLPDSTYVTSFLARPEWNDESIMNTIDILYWNLGRGVVHDERIQDFMKQHGNKWHTVFSRDTNPNAIALHSAAMTTIRMYKTDPDRFPLHVYDNRSQSPSERPYQVAQVGHKVQLAPRVEIKEDEIIRHLHSHHANVDDKVATMVEEARRKLSDPAFLDMIEATERDIPNRDVEVIPLGTGSSIPSKHRNVSATLIRVPGYGSYLFDCGENTLGQLRRMFGFEKADEILSDLKVIWISHLHADHHLGTAGVIKAWRDVTTPQLVGGRLPRLAVVSHPILNHWLREYSDVEDFGFDRLQLINIQGPTQRETAQDPVLFHGATAREFGLTRIDAVRVDHCLGSLACVFTWPTGLRIAFSGDCRPSRLFARVAADCTLLIHEATLDDELQGDAHAKKHCTMSDALRVAHEMRARRVLLTHFSQRYPKVGSVMTKIAGEGVKDQVILLAFDQMHVKLGDFKKADLFMPALRQLLSDEGEDDD